MTFDSYRELKITYRGRGKIVKISFLQYTKWTFTLIRTFGCVSENVIASWNIIAMGIGLNAILKKAVRSLCPGHLCPKWFEKDIWQSREEVEGKVMKWDICSGGCWWRRLQLNILNITSTYKTDITSHTHKDHYQISGWFQILQNIFKVN